MSTHEVRVVRCPVPKPHPNADRLELMEVFGYTCVIPKGSFKEGDLAAYVEPDYVVPETEQFAFLKSPRERRIGAKRLRGVWSEGLLTAAPAGAKEGDNVMEALGIVRYEPTESGMPSGWGVKGPSIGVPESVPDFIRTIPKYDLENLKKYKHLLVPGEPVFVTEKLHGTNARYVWHEGRLYCGSRSQWRKEEPKNFYWEAVKQNSWIEAWCMDHPNLVLFGEIYGAVQDLTYGAKAGELRFSAFDVLDEDHWIPAVELGSLRDHHVPYLGAIEYNIEQLLEWAENDSSVNGGIREGLVVEPVNARVEPHFGRVKLKLISNRYLSR